MALWRVRTVSSGTWNETLLVEERVDCVFAWSELEQWL